MRKLALLATLAILPGLGLIVAEPSSARPRESHRATVTAKLMGMGMCDTCAAHAAEMYLRQPGSPCARLARSALAGNEVAVATLRDFPDYCLVPTPRG